MSKVWNHSNNNLYNCSDGVNAENPSIEKGSKKTLLITISGNRATWEHMGLHGALWRINPEKAGFIFGGELQNPEDPILQEKLSRAMIRSVSVLETNTNIDETIGVVIDGLPPSEFTANGDGVSLFLTGEGKTHHKQEIFNMSGNTELGLAWMKQYPKYTNYNLEKEGVMGLPGCSYYFTRLDHPVVHMLQTNEETLGVHLTEETKVAEGQWYKIDIELFIYCVKSIRENILQNTPSTFNLSNLTVRISKPDGQRWLQIGPQLIDNLIPDDIRESTDCEMIAEARRLAVQRYIDKPLFLTIRLQFEYSLPDTSSCTSSLNSNPNTDIQNSIVISNSNILNNNGNVMCSNVDSMSIANYNTKLHPMNANTSSVMISNSK
jgi:hypothetical protein